MRQIMRQNDLWRLKMSQVVSINAPRAPIYNVSAIVPFVALAAQPSLCGDAIHHPVGMQPRRYRTRLDWDRFPGRRRPAAWTQLPVATLLALPDSLAGGHEVHAQRRDGVLGIAARFDTDEPGWRAAYALLGLPKLS